MTGSYRCPSQALKDAAADGVGAYVDVTTLDLGRDVEVLRRVAEQSEVQHHPLHWHLAGYTQGRQPHNAGRAGEGVHS